MLQGARKETARACPIPPEIALVAEWRGEPGEEPRHGFGAQKALLLHTEGLRAEATAAPEERFFAFYQHLAAQAEGCELILPSPFVSPLAGERAPTLAGGIRYLLRTPALFTAQLRAALRISATARVSLLLPFVSAPEEIVQARGLIEQTMRTLKLRGIAFDQGVRLGISIDSPTAALLSRALIDEADFLVVNTGSLLSHTLPAQSEELSPHLLRAGKEAMLRLCEIAIGNAHLLGRFAGVCGSALCENALLTHILSMRPEILIAPPEQIERWERKREK